MTSEYNMMLSEEVANRLCNKSIKRLEENLVCDSHVGSEKAKNYAAALSSLLNCNIVPKKD